MTIVTAGLGLGVDWLCSSQYTHTPYPIVIIMIVLGCLDIFRCDIKILYFKLLLLKFCCVRRKKTKQIIIIIMIIMTSKSLLHPKISTMASTKLCCRV